MKARYLAVGIFLVGALFVGCSDTIIDPFTSEGRFFSVYGFLDPGAETQVVRVVEISRRSENINSTFDLRSEIDAEVISQYFTDSSIVTTEWNHSLERLDDGSYGHFFKANLLVEAGRNYRLEVIRSDGAKSTAVTSVPEVQELEFLERSELTTNGGGELVQYVSLPADRNIWDFEASYMFEGAGDSTRLMVPYRTPELIRAGGIVNVELMLGRDQSIIRGDLLRSVVAQNEDPYSLTRIGLLLRIMDANWFPLTESNDEEQLAQPDAFSNVTNGYGLWGALGSFYVEWDVDARMSTSLGYAQ